MPAIPGMVSRGRLLRGLTAYPAATSFLVTDSSGNTSTASIASGGNAIWDEVDGTADEVQIQAAIDALSQSIVNEAVTAGTFAVIDNMDGTPASRWSAVNSTTLANEATIKFAGTHSLKVTPSGSNVDPGIEYTFSSTNATLYDFIDFWIYCSTGVNKYRVRIFDGSNNERRYSFHVENTGEWQHIRLPIDTPYFVSATAPTMTAIVKMQISQMAGETSPAEYIPAAQVFYVDQVSFSNASTLANTAVHPLSDTITNSTGLTTYTRGTDYEIDYDSGLLVTITSGSITSGQSLLADYRAGCGAVRVPPGTYVISSAINLRAWTSLDLRGCLLKVDGTQTDGEAIINGTALYRSEVLGGSFFGDRDRFAIDANVRGIDITDAQQFYVRDSVFRDFNGPAVRVVKSSYNRNENIILQSLTVDNCACEYVDHFGEDYDSQGGDDDKAGLIVHDCHHLKLIDLHLDNSHSDAMWVKNCNHGTMSACIVSNSRMGGIFFETCVNWSISGNTVRQAGSRGVTIEYDSKEIAFTGNVVRFSGRECLWICGCTRILASDNVFYAGGRVRMKDGQGDFVDSTIRVSSQTPYNSADNVLLNNVVYSESDYQDQAILVDTDGGTNTQTIIRGNVLFGTQTTITDSGTNTQISRGNPVVSSASTGGSGSGGAGNQYIAMTVGTTTYKVLHDGTV